MIQAALHTRLQLAWRAAQKWVAAWSSDWRRSATSFLLAFEGLLRPMEMGGALRCHLSLPGDISGDD
eukprot:3105240-Amphidinium_carterae.4